ncbi:hypothetical protein GBN24_16775 [Plesiomonas shigelloides]|uniref:hypothetical protein n=1 Tax=Plesiomonas shigelloides TaxID=703 RepID=UPI001261434F|nr:hypothetical protein [Plesiomonas shigelloides]KAB7685797.1 hypothetical protein GBN24_16775 [Plesiomonas shigelloides]
MLFRGEKVTIAVAVSGLICFSIYVYSEAKSQAAIIEYKDGSLSYPVKVAWKSGDFFDTKEFKPTDFVLDTRVVINPVKCIARLNNKIFLTKEADYVKGKCIGGEMESNSSNITMRISFGDSVSGYLRKETNYTELSDYTEYRFVPYTFVDGIRDTLRDIYIKL